MAHVIRHCTEVAGTYYTIIRSSSPGFVYSTTDKLYVEYSAQKWNTEFAIFLADEGGGCYAVTAPTEAGTDGVTYAVHSMQGAGPDPTDPVVASERLVETCECENCSFDCLPCGSSVLDRYRSCFPERCCCN